MRQRALMLKNDGETAVSCCYCLTRLSTGVTAADCDAVVESSCRQYRPIYRNAQLIVVQQGDCDCDPAHHVFSAVGRFCSCTVGALL